MLTTWLHQLTHQATLAANGWGDLIVVGIIFTLIIGGSVANGLRKLGEKLKAGQRNQFNNPTTGGQAGAREMAQHVPRAQQTARQRMGSVSAERQAQLEKLREFRAQQQGRTATSAPRTPSAPGNLTPAQRAARDRARQAYERRAELLARQKQAQEQAARQQTRQSPQGPRPAQAAQRSSAPSSQRQAAVPQQAQRPQSQAQRPQAPVRRAQPSPPRPRIQRTPNATAVGSIGSSVKDTLKEMAGSSNPVHVERLDGRAIISEDSLQVHYHESHHAEKASKFRQKLLAGSSLRAAMVLKEVLEKPNALRDPEDLPGEVVW